MTPTLLPRLCLAAGMLRGLALLLTLTAPHRGADATRADSDAADDAVHEGVVDTERMLRRLGAACVDSEAHRAEAHRQASEVYMNTPDAATLLRWAEAWEAMAETIAAGCDAAPSQLDTLVSL